MLYNFLTPPTCWMYFSECYLSQLKCIVVVVIFNRMSRGPIHEAFLRPSEHSGPSGLPQPLLLIRSLPALGVACPPPSEQELPGATTLPERCQGPRWRPAQGQGHGRHHAPGTRGPPHITSFHCNCAVIDIGRQPGRKGGEGQMAAVKMKGRLTLHSHLPLTVSICLSTSHSGMFPKGLHRACSLCWNATSLSFGGTPIHPS